MTKTSKNHYRKVFKSDHLGVADLEDYLECGKRLIFTIKKVVQEYDVKVAGRVGNHNIAYFKEDIKPMVLNSTNSKVIKGFTGSSFVEDWNNVLVELFVDESVKMKGEIVGGIRIKKLQPRLKKPVLNKDSDKWETAKQRVKEGMSYEELIKHFELTKENYKKLCL